ncbi:MAG TPA: NUDIX hydrolase [Microbacteriaceae bacterium]|nr:NUDIX hydrolase [Microbacteriaceae bacterium]
MNLSRLEGPIADEVIEYPIVSSEVVYRGRVWDVRHEVVEYPGARIARDFVAHTGAVGVLPMNERGEILLINQFRHPSRRQDWEIVAGLLDVAGESPLAAAQRELAEEADLVAGTWNTLVDIIAAPGGSDEAIRIFLARDIASAPVVHDRVDEEAHLIGRWVSLDEAVDAVLERRIQNGPMCTAVLAADAAERRGWRGLGDPNEPWNGHPLWR